MKERMLHDMKPVDFLLAAAVGPPGQRAFYLQARKDIVLVTLSMEKEQVALLATSVVNLIADIDDPPDIDTSTVSPQELEHPLEPLFRVGQMGLGYDHSEQLFAVFMQSMMPAKSPDDPEEEAEEETETADLPVVRFWATGSQMQAFSERALQVVEAGRPVCPLCHEPIDPDGHLCPRSNGHADPVVL